MKYKKNDLVLRKRSNEKYGLYKFIEYDGTIFRIGCVSLNWCLILSLNRKPNRVGTLLHTLDSDIRKATLVDLWKHYNDNP